MGLLNKIFGQKAFDSRLYGNWLSDLNDALTRETIGNVSMTFTSDGKLYYDTIEGEKAQRINMVYWTKDNMLYTDQPSHPRQEKTIFDLPNSNLLTLQFGGQKTKFKRAPEEHIVKK